MGRRQFRKVAKARDRVPANRHAERAGRRRERGVQPAAVGQREGDGRAGPVEAGRPGAVGVPVDEVDQRRFVAKRCRHRVTAAVAKHEARARAVDPHLLDAGVGQVLGQRPQRRYRPEHAPPHLLPLGRAQRRAALVFRGHRPAHQLVDPLLVLETQPRRLSAAEPLGQLGLDPLPNPLLDRVGTHGHAATAGAAAGATARASSASGLRAALAPSGMRARMGSW